MTDKPLLNQMLQELARLESKVGQIDFGKVTLQVQNGKLVGVEWSESARIA